MSRSLLALTLILLVAAPASAGSYKLTDLGVIGTVGDQAGGQIESINSHGAVVGWSQFVCPSSGLCGSFVWKPDAPNAITGQMVKIPDEGPFSRCGTASGINDSGQVLCSDKIWNGGPDFTGTSYTPIVPLATGFNSNLGAINNAGDVVGEGVRSLFDSVVTWWPGNANPRLGIPIDTRRSIGSGLNNNGAFVGRVLADDGHHATLWQITSIFPPAVTATPLNVEFQRFSDALAINDDNVAVGYVDRSPCPPCTAFHPKPVMWAGAQIDLPTLDPSPLSTLDGIARAINAFADVVGTADELTLTPTGTSTAPAAALWTNGTIVNLNNAVPLPAGWRLVAATAINDAGQIAGVAEVGGARHGFLLTPDTTPPDTAPPTTTATLTPASPNGANGWYTGPVAIQFSATDPDSDPSTLQTNVQVDGGPAQVTTSVTVASNGTHSVEFWSTDPAGNTEAKQSVSFKIDGEIPVTTASASGSQGSNGWFTGSAQVTLSATDAVSGIDRTHYTVDGGAVQTYSGPFAVSGDGVHTVVYWSVDFAGNEGAHGSLTARIDTTAPTFTAAASASPASLWPPNNKLVPVTVSGKLTDGGSGIDAATATYAVTDSFGLIQPTGSVTIAPDGSFSFTVPLEARRNGQIMAGRTYIITVTVKDLAGNVATTQTTVAVVHDQR